MITVPKRQLIGILGGMGPAATVDFLQKIVDATPAGRDQDHVPVILHGVPQIPDRSTAIREGSDAPFLPMLAGIRLLERSGADAIAIPCNTAHYWYDRLARTTPVKILHIVDAVRVALQETALQEKGPQGRVALLATRGTLESGLYQRRLGPQAVCVPDDAVQVRVDAIIAAVKRGALEEAAGTAAAIADLLQKAGYRGAVLACTELPVAFAGLTSGLVTVDATLALAQACVRASLECGGHFDGTHFATAC